MKKTLALTLALVLAFSLALPVSAVNDGTQYASDTVAVIKYSETGYTGTVLLSQLRRNMTHFG